MLLDIVDSLTSKVAVAEDKGMMRCIYCNAYVLDRSGRTAHEHTPFCPWRLGKELVQRGGKRR